MTIRYGTLDDAGMLAELGAKTFYDSFAKDNTPEDISLYLEKSFSPEIQSAQLSDPEIVFLIAELDNKPIGYVKLNLNRDSESNVERNSMELERIYAIREYIGKGLGAELMKASIDEARKRECERIWLGVWEKNPRAIAFYNKWGFKEVGKHVFMLGDDLQRDYIMELSLK